jgi:hypothetical protein
VEQSFSAIVWQAPEGRYGFEDEAGNRVLEREGIIPILEKLGENRYRFIGTNFFITDYGLFATAKHVLPESLQDGQIVVWQFFGTNQYYPRPVVGIAAHPTCDVAVGALRPILDPTSRELVLNAKMMLTTAPPSVGDYVATFAYPNTMIEPTEHYQRLHFNPAFYDGHLLENFGNGCGILGGPCYRTSMVINSGASGGPVTGPLSGVFGINSTGMEGTEISHISRIDEMLSSSIVINDGAKDVTLSIAQLAEQGDLKFTPPVIGRTC